MDGHIVVQFHSHATCVPRRLLERVTGNSLAGLLDCEDFCATDSATGVPTLRLQSVGPMAARGLWPPDADDAVARALIAFIAMSCAALEAQALGMGARTTATPPDWLPADWLPMHYDVCAPAIFRAADIFEMDQLKWHVVNVFALQRLRDRKATFESIAKRFDHHHMVTHACAAELERLLSSTEGNELQVENTLEQFLNSGMLSFSNELCMPLPTFQHLYNEYCRNLGLRKQNMSRDAVRAPLGDKGCMLSDRIVTRTYAGATETCRFVLGCDTAQNVAMERAAVPGEVLGDVF